MEDLRLIVDLEDYIGTTPGIHPIITGTFDPAHMKHVAPIVRSYDELQEMGINNPYIILVHSRNTKKTPIATLRERQRWIMYTIDFAAREIAHRVKLCVDMAEPGGRYIYDLPDEQQDRMIRFAGGDKEGEIQQGRIKTKFFPRELDMSSTRVKELMRQTKSHPDLKLALAPKVYEEVVARGYYMKQ